MDILAVPTLLISSTSSPARKRPRGDFRAPIKLLKFSGHRWWIWTGLAMFMIVGRIALLPLLPIPQPLIQDEYSYLLAADTFTHGKVANPGLDQPDFFESPHVLVQPAYISKYPPGQALFLAIGEKLTGNPFWGTVLSCALMVFLYCWAADAWLPPQWTMIAGGLAVIFFFVRLYWMESYFGGAVAACGGALVVGGLGRLLRGKPAAAHVTLALGAVVLYFTRPYEGGVLCLAVLAILGYRFAQIRTDERCVWTRVVIFPSLAVLLAGGIIAGWYNLRTTGHLTQLPFLLYSQQYDLAPKFLMQAETPGKRYANAINGMTHQDELERYRGIRALPVGRALLGQLGYFALHCLLQPFWGFALVLLAISWARVRGRKRWLVLLLVVSVAAMLPEAYILFHYTAPFTIVSVILIAAATRALWYRLAFAQIPKPVQGLAFTLGIAILFGPLMFQYMLLQPRFAQRSRFVQRFDSRSGKQLFFVHYVDGWKDTSEWVYNGASPDQSKLLFAHDLGRARDQELIERHPDRTPWKLVLGPQQWDIHVERMTPAQDASPPSTQSRFMAPR